MMQIASKDHKELDNAVNILNSFGCWRRIRVPNNKVNISNENPIKIAAKIPRQSARVQTPTARQMMINLMSKKLTAPTANNQIPMD